MQCCSQAASAASRQEVGPARSMTEPFHVEPFTGVQSLCSTCGRPPTCTILMSPKWKSPVRMTTHPGPDALASV
jgi:hypothetical protein